MQIKEEIAARGKQVNALIEPFLPKEEGFQKTILEAMNYSIHAGGKRLRPMLMQEVFRLFGGQGAEIEPFMAAIEMIHTYSLVHDDLPAMDNDEYRRGKKTTHAIYGEAMGILTGDALLTYAFETAAGAFASMEEGQEERALRIGKAIHLLAKKAGIYGMVGGQVVDVEAEKKQQQITREQLDFIYQLKTGALIEVSMMIGAILAGASKQQIADVEKIGAKIGLAFQIEDDILDVTSSLEELGKQTGSDEKNAKSTYVTFEGIEQSAKEVSRLSKEAVDLLHTLPGDTEFLRELILYLVDRSY